MSAAVRKIVREVTEELKRESLFFHGSLYSELNGVFPLIPISKKPHYKGALRVLTIISRTIALGECKPLERDLSVYAETLGLLIEHYENIHYSGKQVSGAEVLAFLMEQHGFSQSELGKDLGGQPNLSAILSGKRKLNARQMEVLAKRFRVSPAVFFDSGGNGSTKRGHRSSNLLGLKTKK